jgi:hypothetical protein
MLVLFMAVGISGAQGKKTVYSGSSGVGPWYYDCINECIIGEISWNYTIRDGNVVQWKYKGTYTGETSLKNYTLISVENYNHFFKEYVEGRAYNQTYIETAVIECEGVPIAIYKLRFHVTMNAIGELAVSFESGGEWICL